MESKRLDIAPGEKYGTEVEIEILSVEIRDTATGLRKAMAKVLSAIPHWQNLGDKSVKPGGEIELHEILDDKATGETHWNLMTPGDLWFILGRYEGKTFFEHYR
ncbi:hypothetical protein HYV57_00690 [Candidatus Peregrinibacteria bacterium]|nr:hypothetical protein [Candidatus Peregrinibacteria bacterium]